MTILSTDHKLEIGETVDNGIVTDREGKPHNQIIFKVIAESTKEAFYEEFKDYPDLHLTNAGNAKYYYEVSMD